MAEREELGREKGEWSLSWGSKVDSGTQISSNDKAPWNNENLFNCALFAKFMMWKMKYSFLQKLSILWVDSISSCSKSAGWPKPPLEDWFSYNAKHWKLELVESLVFKAVLSTECPPRTDLTHGWEVSGSAGRGGVSVQMAERKVANQKRA